MKDSKPKPNTPAPEITYIVSTYNRPMMLPVCLWSIAGQFHQDFDCVATDNSTDPGIIARNKRAIEDMDREPSLNGKFRYLHTGSKIKISDCYWSAEYAISKGYARGRWLAFPCDDTYLSPGFGLRLLLYAHKAGAPFVFCEYIVVGVEAGGADVNGAENRVWRQRLHRTGKTCYMVTAEAFARVGGFRGKLHVSGYCNADYYFSTQIAESGLRIATAPDCLVFHN